ncbi:lysine 2,3-aminomutase [Rhodospirillales bacterium TMPK1]|uniref:Lysine 2,3-aminomutase n=1 Tax=Roseiterribacter gracilis TaxID=2812848 RepID=A0A8S8X9I9_9PROT|nr:lysine 2,3-aminomutase [Rhodospirillales bacterium TMPK1]
MVVAAIEHDADPARDPIALQFVPSSDELITTPDELADPIGDSVHEKVPGVIHRYPDRVLLKPIHACAVYCRFCFRRETVGPGARALTDEEIVAALAYIASHKSIWEVILTGGDPLLLSPRRMRDLITRLDAIEHVKTIRIHTRVPIVDPARVDADMVAALRAPTPVWVGVHTNHARELTIEARAALARLADAGLPLIAQTVLLRGVNDDADTLEELFRSLVECRVKPYYLHHPDLAPGTSRFRLPLDRGRALLRTLRGRLSGLAQPTYVLDLPGGHGKVPVGPDYQGPNGTIEDPWGQSHPYPPNPDRD